MARLFSLNSFFSLCVLLSHRSCGFLCVTLFVPFKKLIELVHNRFNLIKTAFRAHTHTYTQRPDFKCLGAPYTRRLHCLGAIVFPIWDRLQNAYWLYIMKRTHSSHFSALTLRIRFMHSFLPFQLSIAIAGTGVRHKVLRLIIIS